MCVNENRNSVWPKVAYGVHFIFSEWECSKDIATYSAENSGVADSVITDEGRVHAGKTSIHIYR